jgi:two-component system, NarL family, invasion response regulator UvrY
MINIIVADDHPIVRKGIKSIINDHADMCVIGETGDGHNAIEICKKLKPDVLLLDISMEGPGILEIIKRIKIHNPTTKILVLSIHSESNYALRTIKAGASGYLTKQNSTEILAEAIRQVHANQRYVTREVAELLIDSLTDGSTEDLLNKLTNREFQVLCYLGEGKRFSEISSLLSLSPKTISTYRTRLLEKLGLKTTSELVKFALRYNLDEDSN